MKDYFLFDNLNMFPDNENDESFGMLSNFAFKALNNFIRTEGKQKNILTFLPVLLFVMDDGRGFTTCVKCFTNTIRQVSKNAASYVTFSEYTLTEADEVNNVSGTITEIAEMASEDNIHIAAVDISNYMTKKLFDKYMRDFLKLIPQIRPSVIFILRCKSMDREILNEALGYMEKFIDIKAVDFPPVSDSDCLKFVKKTLADYKIKMEEETPAFFDILEKNKSDGRFYGFHTLHKIAEQIQYNTLKFGIENTTHKETGAVISVNDLYKKIEKSGAEELDELIGLEDIKKQIAEIMRASKYKKEMGIKGMRSTLHMTFTGSPGTGKTLVARLVGKIFKENGILPTGKLVEVTRKDLIGEYIGQTALKTIDVCKMAMGGVLFIDEAYELAQDVENRRDFGPEAISTLIAEMENNRDKFVVIMAGYSKDMERLFKINAGLKDRFAYRLDFPNYGKSQLADIFLYLCAQNGHILDEEAKEEVYAYFNKLPNGLISSKDFANARFVRNLVERTITKAALRFHKSIESISENDLDTLTKEDFNAALNDKDFVKLINKSSDNKIGYVFQAETR